MSAVGYGVSRSEDSGDLPTKDPRHYHLSKSFSTPTTFTVTIDGYGRPATIAWGKPRHGRATKREKRSRRLAMAAERRALDRARRVLCAYDPKDYRLRIFTTAAEARRLPIHVRVVAGWLEATVCVTSDGTKWATLGTWRAR